MRGAAERGQRFEEQLEHAGLAQTPEPFPDAVPRAKLGWQGPLGDVVHGEIVQGLEELTIVAPLVAPRRERQAWNTSSATAQSSSVIRVSMVDLAKSQPSMNHRNSRKGITLRCTDDKSVHTA